LSGLRSRRCSLARADSTDPPRTRLLSPPRFPRAPGLDDSSFCPACDLDAVRSLAPTRTGSPQGTDSGPALRASSCPRPHGIGLAQSPIGLRSRSKTHGRKRHETDVRGPRKGSQECIRDQASGQDAGDPGRPRVRTARLFPCNETARVRTHLPGAGYVSAPGRRTARLPRAHPPRRRPDRTLPLFVSHCPYLSGAVKSSRRLFHGFSR